MNAIVTHPDAAKVGIAAAKAEQAAPSAFAAFVNDDTTTALLGRMSNDGMPPPAVHRGGVAAALTEPEIVGAARVLLLDLSDSPDPLSDLDALAEFCDPDVVVLALGEINDVAFYRQVMDAGIAEYMVKPLNEEQLRRALQQAREAMAAKAAVAGTSTVYGVVGARGGIGASMVALNLGAALGDQGHGKTLILDLDLHFGTTALSLDLEPSRGLREALEEPSRVDPIFLAGSTVMIRRGLYLMAAEDDLGVPTPVNGDNLASLLGVLKDAYNRIVIEIPRYLLAQDRRILSPIDQLVLVTDPTLPGVRDASRLLTVARDAIAPENLSVIANRVGRNKREEISPRDIEKALGVKLTGTLEDMPKSAGFAIQKAQTLLDADPRGKMTKDVSDIAAKIREQAGEGPTAAIADPKAKKRKLFRKKED